MTITARQGVQIGRLARDARSIIGEHATLQVTPRRTAIGPGTVVVTVKARGTQSVTRYIDPHGNVHGSDPDPRAAALMKERQASGKCANCGGEKEPGRSLWGYCKECENARIAS